jgi:GTP cyclohydrolase I
MSEESQPPESQGSMAIEPHAVHEKHAHHELHPHLAAGYASIMKYLERDGDLTDAEKANYADTAVRAAKAFRDLTSTRSEISEQLRYQLSTGFPKDEVQNEPRSGMIVQGPIQAYALCPHHLLEVEYEAWVAYQPVEHGTVLGLSKLTRITQILSRRPVLQEQLASDIANVLCLPKSGALFPGIQSHGSIVNLIGKHSCMSCRGVRGNALTSVTEVRSMRYEHTSLEDRFTAEVNRMMLSGLRR